ncbi:MAG: beta-galactosidase [Defluviitaleaceae bacterium]|nr:beta-galactosidase [Defluviitaleaceae bacterium]
MLHGGDYNPDQWLAYPEILSDDLKYMKQTRANAFSVGIFAWAALEPREGEFTFGWLDKILDDIYGIGGRVILATPSGARPAWLSQKYPEVNRTDHRRQKMLHGGRHNHCFSSPVYREKVGIINRKLAERYKDHPALFMWHISNEYSGECHCLLCQDNFRRWLREKYGTIDALNAAYWAAFWSHTFNDFDQLESPTDIGEGWIHGLNLDWKRFVTHQTLDFYRHEIKDIRVITPDVPVTNNFMADFPNVAPFTGFDYAPFAREIDVVSWDAYPPWHNDYESTAHLASKLAFLNDYFRALKDAPFYILESTPSMVNWQPVNRAKRPGMHKLSTVACLAHGADAIMYFQWRKSRGSTEKLHGAVIDHDNSPDNRVFCDVAEVGQMLENLSEIADSRTHAQVAVLFDTESHWALDNAEGFSRQSKKYSQTVHTHHKAFWQANVPVDVITPDKCADLTRYKIVVVPMLYLMREKTMRQLQTFTQNGGTLVMTYISALADENDLMYLDEGAPILRDTFGIRITETDTLYPSQRNGVCYNGKEYEALDYCAIIQPTNDANVEILSTYTSDFYANSPAITVRYTDAANKKGAAYFIAARTGEDFLQDFYNQLIKENQITQPSIQTPPGVSVQTRHGNNATYHFVMNYTEEAQIITLANKMPDLISGIELNEGEIKLQPYDVMVLSNR